MSPANVFRGEASIEVGGAALVLRPSFNALIAAEEELGSLFEIVEHAAAGALQLQQIVALFDHLSRGRPEEGLAGVTPVLTQILQGR